MWAKLRAAFTSVEGFLSYLKERISEKSTWAGLIGGFSGAAALQHPWDYVSAICGIIMVLIPTKNSETQDETK